MQLELNTAIHKFQALLQAGRITYSSRTGAEVGTGATLGNPLGKPASSSLTTFPLLKFGSITYGTQKERQWALGGQSGTQMATQSGTQMETQSGTQMATQSGIQMEIRVDVRWADR
jgi:hypothetical protein